MTGSLRVGAAVVLVALLQAGGAALAADSAVLENDALRLGLTAAGGARLTALVAKKQGRDLLNVRASIPLYQMEVEATRGIETIDALHADATSLATPDARTVEVTSRHARLGLVVSSTIRLPAGDAAAEFTIAVRRDGDRPLVRLVRYPGWAVPLAAAGRSARVLMPVADGEIIVDPIRALGDGEVRGYNYPGPVSAQLMAVYDTKGGLATWAADGTGQYKRLCLRRAGGDALLYFEHVIGHLHGPEVRVPYAVRLVPFEGGWEQAADRYKEWAAKQPWCARRLETRDLPPLLDGPSFVLGLNVREAAAGGAVDRSAAIPPLAAGWGKGLDLPITALLLSWEKHGPWIAPDYFPPFGKTGGLDHLIADLHGAGDRAMLYLSGLNVTLEKTARNGAPGYAIAKADRDRLQPAAIVGQDGRPLVEGTAAGEGVGAHLVLCPATAEARRVLGDAFDHLLASGADIIQVDQIPGGGTPPCFATTHGHPPAGGDTTYTAMSGLLDDLEGRAAARRPRAAVSLEEPGELFIPHVDLFHCRDYMQGLWPRDGRGSLGVPLFAYLYHEYALGYGGDSAPIATSDDAVPLALYAQAMNLIAGRLPGAAVWMRGIPWDQVRPAQRAFMRDAAGLLRGPAGRFILRGRMLDLGVAEQTRILRGRWAGSPFAFAAPRLMARGFALQDGSIGFLYINATEAPQQVRFDPGPGRSGARAVTVWPTSGTIVKSGAEYALKPWEIVFLRLERAS